MRGLYCVTFLLAACRGDADGVGSPDNGSRRHLQGYPTFRCHLGGDRELRLGVIADHPYISRQQGGEEGFKREVHQLVNSASRVYNKQLGFRLRVEHLVVPSAFNNNDFLKNGRSCQNIRQRMTDFNQFRRVYLADKPAGLWFLWSTCLGAPGAVSQLSNACWTNNHVGIVTSMNLRQFIHEVGHSFGAEHPRTRTSDPVDVMLAGGYPEVHFGVRHESALCAVLGRPGMLNLDACWKQSFGTKTRGQGSQTPKGVGRQPETTTVHTGQPHTPQKPTAGRRPGRQSHPGRTPDCSQLKPGWASCEKQNAACSTRYYPRPRKCMSTTRSKTQKEVGRQPETNTVQAGQPQRHRPKAERQPGRQSNPEREQDCSQLKPGWASCEKQSAGCRTQYYPLPRKCMSTTRYRSDDVQADTQGNTSTVVAILCGGAVLVAIGATYAFYAMNHKTHGKNVKQAGQE